MAGALALGGLTLAGIGVKAIAEYLNPPPDGLYKKILDTPFAADELPLGWSQVTSYSWPVDPKILQKFGDGKVREAVIEIKMKENSMNSGIVFIVFESPERAQTALKGYQYSDSRSVSGIGDVALFDLVNMPVPGNCAVAVDQVLVVPVVRNGDIGEQIILSLAKSSVKYLARIGVTPGVK